MANENHSFSKNIIQVLSTNVLVVVLGFVNSLIFPRILTIEDYALYHTYLLYLNYVAICHLGFPNGMSIKYAGKTFDSIDRKQYKTESCILIGVLLLFSLGFIVASLVIDDKMLLFVGASIIPVVYYGSIKSMWISWGQFKKYRNINSILVVSVPFFALLFYFIRGELPGHVYILINLSVSWIVFIYLFFDLYKNVKGFQCNTFISKENIELEKIGFGFLIGSYINTLFTSADKQFIKWFFGDQEFAFYSFGMSMQSLMSVFIISISQPLFPKMASLSMTKTEYNSMKRMLIVFGSLSGCAYFGASFIVKMFIKKYIPSIDVINIYFMVFPAMAVVNCIYVNLYKIHKITKTYICTIAGMLVTAVVLNILFVKLYPDYLGVAIATTITYYIWFLIGFKQFEEMKLEARDIAYIIIFLIVFRVLCRIQNDILGFFTFLIVIIAMAMLVYREDCILLYKKFCKGINSKKKET